MKEKVKFILATIIVPLIFLIILGGGVIVSLVKREESSPQTVTTSNIQQPTLETGTTMLEISTENFLEMESTGTEELMNEEHEIEDMYEPVPITGLTQQEIVYIGDDMEKMKDKIQETIIGAGYSGAKELKMDISEISKVDEEEYLILTFDIDTTLFKDPILLLKYQKKTHSFETEIW